MLHVRDTVIPSILFRAVQAHSESLSSQALITLFNTDLSDKGRAPMREGEPRTTSGGRVPIVLYWVVSRDRVYHDGHPHHVKAQDIMRTPVPPTRGRLRPSPGWSTTTEP
jgi:hypothetical protein